MRVCDPDQMSRAADRLGDGAPDQQTLALPFALLAVENDPASPFRWCDLGDLYMAVRRPSEVRESDQDWRKARAAFERAEELSPHNPNILQRVANFYWQASEPEEALKRTYQVLKQVREFDEIIFSTYARFGVPQGEVLAQGVPLEPEPARAYLRYVFARGDVAEASAAWRWGSRFLTDQLARTYVSLLWRHQEFAVAQQAWAGYPGNRAGDYPRRNLIFNGGFETEPAADNPLDWRRDDLAGVEMARDTQVRPDGTASMRIRFLGTQNVDFHALSQTQPVAPGAYRLRAMVKTEGLTTDQGVRLRVFDPEAPARLDVRTAAMTGSSDWRFYQFPVEVHAPTRLVRVEVARQPSLKFDNKISGTLWLDSIELTPITPAK